MFPFSQFLYTCSDILFVFTPDQNKKVKYGVPRGPEGPIDPLGGQKHFFNIFYNSSI